MAINFRVFQHQTAENLHLKLKGDFDGTSALELLNILETVSSETASVFINTSALNKIHPFGREVFRRNLHKLKSIRRRLKVIGDPSTKILLDQGLYA